VGAKDKAGITRLESASQCMSKSVAVEALFRHGANRPDALDAIGMSCLSKTDCYQGSIVTKSIMEPRYLYSHFPRPRTLPVWLAQTNFILNPLSSPDGNLIRYSWGHRFFLLLSACWKAGQIYILIPPTPTESHATFTTWWNLGAFH